MPSGGSWLGRHRLARPLALGCPPGRSTTRAAMARGRGPGGLWPGPPWLGRSPARVTIGPGGSARAVADKAQGRTRAAVRTGSPGAPSPAPFSAHRPSHPVADSRSTSLGSRRCAGVVAFCVSGRASRRRHSIRYVPVSGARVTPWVSLAWQAYLHARDAAPGHRFRWTYHFAWGLDDIAAVFADLWERVGGRSTVGCLWNDDLQGTLLRHERYGFAPVTSPARAHPGRPRCLPRTGLRLRRPGRPAARARRRPRHQRRHRHRPGPLPPPGPCGGGPAAADHLLALAHIPAHAHHPRPRRSR
ncbi:hypothetical protein SUDANB113_00028 [Streptomyces sp. enrichment culture]